MYLITNVNEEFYRVGTFLRLDAIAFGVLIRIYLEKIRNNLFNIFSAIFIAFTMQYFLLNLENLSIFKLFLGFCPKNQLNEIFFQKIGLHF